MPDLKRYGIAGATLATILLTGQVMQMASNDKAAKVAAIQAMPLPVEISDIKLTASDGSDAEASVLAALDVGKSESQSPVRSVPVENDSCEITMLAAPKAAALVSLTIQAPCQPNERVVIHHNGMMFAEATDSIGTLETTVPALAETAVFIASFASGEGAVVTTNVDTLPSFDRAAVQVQGTSGISLHAREFDAEYGTEGHVWSDTPGSIADAATGQGGFVLQLGDATLDNPITAEVYTFPTSIAKTEGEVLLSVDIEITATNCGQDIEAQTLQTDSSGGIKVQNLDMTMPDCDTVGDFLVLNNLVKNLKVASN
ncbi:hypothetical protein KO498_04485 [Lentibacter algarum]|uniref:hypothetical protein n=1 Tax=Lentibacter algarum TaxID=576131 RepID=UPI001C07BEB6|nr:hypothetical protein [Lentibacter algarum]MBU2981065.1 hypothetical protein [Lentibacter algarum]